MKLRSEPFIKKYEYWITPIGGIASIASLIIMIFFASVSAYIALGLVVVFLLTIIFKFNQLISRYLNNKYPEGVVTISNSSLYETDESGILVKYEVYKHIQCKKSVMHEFPHNFKWSGSKDPKIISKLQKLDKPLKKGNEGEYDCLLLKLEHPIFFDETALIHILMEMDDSDGKSSPHLETRIVYPTKMVHYSVKLRYKESNYNKPAYVKKRLVNTSLSPKYESIDVIEFNKETKSYEYYLLNPEIGYFYRIEWEK